MEDEEIVAYQVPRYVHDYMDNLLAHLGDIEATGNFATSGSLATFVNPGISVAGLDVLRLPASTEQIQQLVKHAHQAPFGKGQETLIDTTVRNTWQINASDIQCTNPEWTTYLSKIVVKACKKLGVPSPKHVEAVLYKMLIYDEGGKFVAHQDTEREPGMFASLVVCLPCKHEGGDVMLEHGGTTMKMSTSKESGFNAAYLAWYSDVTHTICEVTSGHRLALTYNLVNNHDASQQTAQQLTSQRSDLANLLKQSTAVQKHLAYMLVPLSHQYTCRRLSLSRMKGHDLQVVSAVAAACKHDTGLAALLGQLEYKVEDQFEDDQDMSLCLSGVRTLAGADLRINLSVPLYERCTMEQLYEYRWPDKQFGGGYTGNEYATLDQMYKDTVSRLLNAARSTDDEKVLLLVPEEVMDDLEQLSIMLRSKLVKVVMAGLRDHKPQHHYEAVSDPELEAANPLKRRRLGD